MNQVRPRSSPAATSEFSAIVALLTGLFLVIGRVAFGRMPDPSLSRARAPRRSPQEVGCSPPAAAKDEKGSFDWELRAQLAAGSAIAGPAMRPPDLRDCLDSLLLVRFCIDLRDRRAAVSKNDASGLDSNPPSPSLPASLSLPDGQAGLRRTGRRTRLLPQLGGGVVADPSSPMLRRAGLVRVPSSSAVLPRREAWAEPPSGDRAVGLAPGEELLPLLLRQSLLPLGDGFVLTPGQWFGRREGAVAGTGDRAAAGVALVPLAGRPLGSILAVRAGTVALG